MTPRVHVHLLPELAPVGTLTGATVVVIDVLRATTTMVYALAAGARTIIPCLTIEEARRLAENEASGGKLLLGGERGGLRIEGFDLGNSPAEYTADAVAGRAIVMTTTNGTRAMRACAGAEKVLMGAFVNASAVVIELAGTQTIELVCAGTRGQITRDDTLLAGLLVEKLLRRSPTPCQLNDQAALARDAWRGLGPPLAELTVGDRPQAMDRDNPADVLADVLAETQGGRDLESIGLESDLQLAAALDRFDIVPRLDVETWKIE